MHMLLLLLQQPVSDVVKSALNNNALLGAGIGMGLALIGSPKPRPTSAAR